MNSTLLRESQLKLGTWLSTGSPVVTELAAECGLEWLLFDLEHGCTTEADVLPQLQALRGSSTAGVVRVGVVRVGAPYADLIARVLDWGADGLMVPHVSTVEQAEACVRAMRYPPRGERGYSRSVRAYGYGLRPPGDDADLGPVFFAQIETLEAVENAPAIANVDGVDVLFVGPADLQFDLKARGTETTPTYRDCLERVAAAAHHAGKVCGLLVRDPADVEGLRQLGFTHLAIDSELSILRAAYQRIMTMKQG